MSNIERVGEATWTLQDLQRELRRYEEELRAAGLTDKSVRTYLDHPTRFLRWLAGEYSPQGSPGRVG